jgi:hypothetical protein
VFIPRYRLRNLYGKIKEDVREILRTLCLYKKVEIVDGAVCFAGDSNIDSMTTRNNILFIN